MMNMWFNLLTTTTLIAVQLCVVNAQNFTLTQPATGPSITCQGSNVTLQCVILFNGIPQNPNWRRNGTLVDSNVLTNHQIVLNPTYNAFIDLMITNVTLENDNTEYDCAAVGSDITSSIVLNVTGGPPAPVTSLDVSELCVNGFIVSWDPIAIVSESVCGTVSYDLTISPSDETIMMEINETSYSVTKSPYQFGRLTNSANLTVTVISTNLGGSGQRMMEVKIPGLSQAVPSSVRNLTNTNTTKNAIAIQWDAAKVSYCGDVLKYYVTMSYENGTLVDGGSTEQTNYTFDDLMENMYYVIVALANNAAGNGTATTIVVEIPGPQDDNDDDDSVAAIVGGVVGTFIITLVVTALISVIIIRMYYKYWYEMKRKPNNDNSASVQQDTIKMDNNPSYATATMATDTIKMDTNPTYTVAK